MPFSVNFIRKIYTLEPPLKDVLLALLEKLERSREESVTKKEFLEFARATEENFERISKAIGELADVQKRGGEELQVLARDH